MTLKPLVPLVGYCPQVSTSWIRRRGRQKTLGRWSSSPITERPLDKSARIAGAFLLLTAAVTAVMIIARVAADADQETLLESLKVADENRALYSIFGAARLLSGVTLFVAAWLLLRTWIIRDCWATPLVPYLFALSGICTLVSGVTAILIAAYLAPDITYVDGAATGEIAPAVEVASGLLWIVGKIGFTAAGLAVIVAARYQWQVGGTRRWISPGSLVIGVAMQSIWIDAATVVHPIIGTAFLLWFLAVGTMLSTGRVERRFVARYG